MFIIHVCRQEVSDTLRPIPLGGDQLTCERVRGAHRSMADGDTPEERLEGLFSMIEDFHEKMNFLQVIIHLVTIPIRQCPQYQ